MQHRVQLFAHTVSAPEGAPPSLLFNWFWICTLHKNNGIPWWKCNTRVPTVVVAAAIRLVLQSKTSKKIVARGPCKCLLWCDEHVILRSYWRLTSTWEKVSPLFFAGGKFAELPQSHTPSQPIYDDDDDKTTCTLDLTYCGTVLCVQNSAVCSTTSGAILVWSKTAERHNCFSVPEYTDMAVSSFAHRGF